MKAEVLSAILLCSIDQLNVNCDVSYTPVTYTGAEEVVLYICRRDVSGKTLLQYRAERMVNYRLLRVKAYFGPCLGV